MALSKDDSGAIILQNEPSASSNYAKITLKKSSEQGADSNGKFGSVVVFYDNNRWMTQKTNQKTGGLGNAVPATILTNTSFGLLVFQGSIPDHGWGTYSYIIALSHTKFLIVQGTDNGILSSVVKSVGSLE